MADYLKTSDKIIMAAEAAAPILNAVALNASITDTTGYKNVVCKIVNPGVEAWNDSTGYWANSSTIGETIVQLTERELATMSINDLQYAEDELQGAIDNWAPAAGRKLGNSIGHKIAGVISSATPLTTFSIGAAGSTTDQLTLANLAKLAADLKHFAVGSDTFSYDPAETALVVPYGVYASILALLPANVLGSGKELATGVVNSLLGFKAIVPANVTSTSLGSALVGYLVPTGSVVMAARAIHPQTNNTLDYFRVDSNGEGRLPVALRVSRDEKTGTQHFAAETYYGVKIAHNDGDAAGAPQVVAVRMTAAQ